MAIGDVSLTGAMRNTLVSLQDTSRLMDRTQERLSTGKRVNSALDNPANFFAAQAHSSRANILDSRKDAMGEAIQTIKVADKSVKAITSLVENLRGIVSQARSLVGNASGASVSATNDAALTNLITQYNEVRTQIDELAGDSSYKGTNLANSTTNTLTVSFNETGSNTLVLSGFNATTAAAGLNISAASGWVYTSAQSTLDTIETSLNDALTELRNNTASLSSNLSIIQTRMDFTTDMVNALTEGANKLTIADTNEEGANLLMLQTRQQLGTTALSLASQAAQSVLRLF